MRASIARPYGLTFVPTKAAAFHVIWSCSDMVQNYVCTLAFPLRGRWLDYHLKCNTKKKDNMAKLV